MTVIRGRKFHQKTSRRPLTGVSGVLIGIPTGYGIVVMMTMMASGATMAGGSSISIDITQI